MVEKFKLAVVDNEEGANAAAIDAAEANLVENKSELRGAKGFLKKIWKHNLAKEYYRQKEIAKTKKLIFESGNVYAAEQGSKEEHDEAMAAIIDRFTSDYDEMIHTEAGEKKVALDEKQPEQKELKEDISNLIKDYAVGNLDDTTFQEEKIRILQEASANEKSVIGKGSMYADNLLMVAKQIKANVEHGQKLEDMDLEFDVIVGKAKSGVRTEAHYNKIDKLVDKISSSKIGSLVNETTVAGAVGAAYCLGTAVSQKLASSKLFAWGSFGAATALSGGIAALKERKRLEDERRQHNREMAQGKKFNDSVAPKRAELEKFRYNTESATELTEKLKANLYEKDGALKEISQAELETTLASLAEIEARIKISDQRGVDLISFSDLKNVEQERFALDIARAKAKVDLRKILDKNKDLNLPIGDKFDDGLDKLTSTRADLFLEDGGGLEEKDRLFKKMQRKEMAKTALKTVAIGLTIGAAAQEIRSMFSADQQGLVERLFDKKSEGKSATAFEGLRRWLVGGDSPRLGGPMHEEIINSGHLKLPEGSTLVPEADGTYSLMSGDEMIANNLKFNANGSLTEEAKSILAHNDVIASENLVTSTVEHPGTISSGTTTEGLTTEELIKNKPDLFHQVKRELWFDNDTKAFDKNELKLWWGGDQNTGMDNNGNYVFNVKHMMPAGSYHGNESVNAQELIKNNGLKMVFSLSRETQNMVCEVPIDANGNAIIDKDSEIAKLLFATENGKAKFLGKFAEVVQSVGQNEDGTEKIKMLATHVGDGLKEIDPSTVEQIKNITTTEQLQTLMTTLDVPVDAPIDPIPVFPIMGRSPLEKTYKGLAYGYGYNDNNYEALDKKYFSKRRSEELVKDPLAKLDQYKETESYLSKFDDEYKSRIEKLAEQAGEMEETIKLSICIPAAGHQEGKNIYKSLENYTHQTANPAEYEICIFVNQPDKDREGNEIKPDETIAEIKRFQKDYPDIRVKVMNQVLPLAEARIGNARKLLGDSVLYRHHQRGKEAPDLIMVSNDADNEGIAPDYVKNFIKKFEADDKIDGMLGQLDWDPASYIKYPAVHIGTRLFQFLNTQGRLQTDRMSSSGANFAFRSSIYSAIGGYIKDLDGGEDVAVGQAIIAARQDHKAIKFAGARVSRVYTSSRRAIDAWKSGLSPSEQWDKGFSAFDDEVRGFDLGKDKQEINFDDKKYLAKLKKELEYVITRTLNVYEKGEELGKDHVYYRENIDRLGIKYETTDKGEVVIKDMSRLIKKLKQYQKMGVELRDYKSGKIKKEVLEKASK